MGNRPPSRTMGIPACRAVRNSFDPVNYNLFHDVNAGLAGNQKDVGISYLAQGGRCNTWQLDRAPPRSRQREPERVILKTLRWYQPYDERFFDNQWRHALALERLRMARLRLLWHDWPHSTSSWTTGICTST